MITQAKNINIWIKLYQKCTNVNWKKSKNIPISNKINEKHT